MTWTILQFLRRFTKRKGLRPRRWRFALNVELLEDRFAPANISYSTAASPYTQNFSTLPSAGGTATVSAAASTVGPYDLTQSTPTGNFGASGLTGWYGVNLIAGNGLRWGAGQPSTTTGAVFDFNKGSGSQALGTISTTTTSSRFGAILINNTGVTLTKFTLSYTGEEWWENTGSGLTLTFGYELGASTLPIDAGTAPGSSFNFTAPKHSVGGQFLDGTVAANQAAISGTVSTGFSWTNNQALAIFWDKGGGASSSPGLGIANLSFTAFPGITTTTVTSSSNASTFGQSLIFTATVNPSAGTPTGTVTFKDGATSLGTSPLSSGKATITAPSSVINSVATHTITAIYGGDTNYNGSTSSTFPQTVTKATTSTTVSSLLNPSTFGTAVTFTATITPGSGTGMSGTVTFRDSGASIGTAAVSGTSAKFTTTISQLAAGSHTITAVYGGDTNFSGSTSATIVQTVNQTATTTTITSSANPANVGIALTFTATVSGGTGMTGTVTFSDGGTSLATSSISGGTAVLPETSNSVSIHSITASYGGDANFGSSTSSTFAQTVVKATTTTTVTSSTNPSTYPSAVTFTASVAGGLNISGTVTFSDGGTSIGTGSVSSGAATFATATAQLVGGTHSIAASYSGDANFNGSTSSNFLQTVNQAITTTVAVSSLNPSIYGSTATVTATVSSGAGISGTVTFSDGGTSLATTSVSSTLFQDTFDTENNGVPLPNYTGFTNWNVTQGSVDLFNSDSFSGLFPQNGMFLDLNGSSFVPGRMETKSPLVLQPGHYQLSFQLAGSHRGDGSDSVIVSLGSLYNQTLTLPDNSPLTTYSANISVGSATSATLVFDSYTPDPGKNDNIGLILDNVALSSSDLVFASYTSSALTGGTHTLAATYGGDTNYAGSSGNILQTINRADTTSTLAASASSANVGQPVAFTVNVQAVSPGFGAPTGAVTFMDGGSSIATAALSAGTLTFSYSQLADGTHTITAQYGGDTNFNTSSSNPVAVTVTGLTTTTSVTSSAASGSVYSQSVTITATVTPTTPGSVVPTGTVTFREGNSTVTTTTLNAGGLATYTTSALSVGTHSLSVIYAGDSNFVGSTSATFAQTVIRDGTTTSINSSSNPATEGNLVTFTATVTATNPGTGLPIGPSGIVTFMDAGSSIGTGVLSSGTATFGTSTLTQAATHSITAAFPGDGNYLDSTSGTLLQTVKQLSMATLTSSVDPSVFGQNVIFTVTINGTTTIVPTGVVTFKDGAATLGTATLASAADSSGTATIATSTLTVGNHTISVVYSGDALSDIATGTLAGGQIVNRDSTTAVVSSGSDNPSVFGENITLTATVTADSPGTGVPTGAVIFQDNGTSLATATLSQGVATFVTHALNVPNSAHPITAVYGGDINFTGSPTSAIFPQTVDRASTSTTLVSGLNPAIEGNLITFTATVVSLAPGSGIPSGVVAFLDNNVTIGSGTLSSGTATFTTNSLSVGLHPISAIYGSDSNYSGSTSATVTQTVKQLTTTSLISDINPSRFNQSVALTATVAGTTNNPVTGTVTFKDGPTILATITLDGAASAIFSTSSFTIGSHAITVLYSGNAGSDVSTAALPTQTVDKAATTVSLTSVSNPSVFGQSVTFTATVTAQFTGTPTGTVTFTDNGASLGTGTLSGGSVTLTTSSLTVATRSIAASYSGDGNFTANSTSLLQTVNRASTTTTLTSSPANPVYAQSVTFTATVSIVNPGAGTLTGTVTFLDSGSSLGTGSVAGGKAVFTTNSLTAAASPHTMTAIYGGDVHFLDSTSAEMDQTIGLASTTTTPTSSPNPALNGQAITFTASVAGAFGGTPSGTITFRDNGVSLATVALSSAVASYTTSALSMGSHTISEIYSGDSNFAGSTSANLLQRVKFITSTTVVSAPNPSAFNSAAVFTAMVTSAGGVPTGTVTFRDGGTSLATALLNGAGLASFSTSTLAGGTHSITASYGSDINFDVSTSAAYVQTVKTSTSSTALTGSPNPSIRASTVEFTATVTGTGSTPTGTVTFKEGTTVLGTRVLASGKASFGTFMLAAGTHTITAVYGGDANFGVSTSAAVTQTVSSTTTTSGTYVFQQGVTNQGLSYSGTADTMLDLTAPAQGAVNNVSCDLQDGSFSNNISEDLLDFTNIFGSGTGQIPAGSTITAGSIVLNVTNNGDGADFYRLLQSWAANENTITWTNAFGNNGAQNNGTDALAAADLSVASVATGLITFNVGTTSLQVWSNNPSSNFGWLVYPTGTNGWTWDTKEGSTATNRPKLTVSWTNTVAAPELPAALDIINGALNYTSSAGKANNLSVSLSNGTYTFTDTTEVIRLTESAILAGWTGDGTNTVIGPSSSVTSLSVKTGDQNDLVTLNGADKPITINGGGDPADMLSINGNVTSGAVTVSGVNSITQTSGTTINAGAGSITLTAATSIGTSSNPIQTQAGTITAITNGGGVFLSEADGANVSATVTGGSGPVQVSNTTGVLTIVGATNADGGAITLTSPGGVVVNAGLGDSNSGPITVNAGTSDITFNSQFTLGANTANFTSGTPVVFASSASSNGGTINASSGLVVASGSTLSGTGTINGPVTIQSGGTISPGFSPGVVHVGNLALAAGSTYKVDLNGTAPGTGYDQISVIGTVNLGGATLNVSLGYTSAIGDSYTIIDNDDVDPVTGTFAGLSEGSILSAGGRSFQITYAGGTNQNDVVLMRVKNPTTLAFTSSTGTSAVFGQAVTFSVNVTSGAEVPTGTITFQEGTSTIGTGTLNGGVVSFLAGSLALGTHTLTGSYAGDGFNLGSQSNLILSVNPAGTVTTLTSSPNPSGDNQAVSFTATVTAGSPGSGIATGTVTFQEGGNTLGTTTLNGSGVGVLPLGPLPGGQHTITANYSGDGNFTTSTSANLIQSVVLGSTVAVTPPSTVVFGQSAAFTATVVSSGVIVPTGTVTFQDGVVSLGTGLLDNNGLASFTASLMSASASPHTITAVYGGDKNVAGSTSAGVLQTVTPAVSSTTLTSSSNSTLLGQSVSFTATVTIANPSTASANGVITFMDGTSTLGTAPLVSSNASFTTANLSGGSHSVTAVYDGAGNFTSSTATPTTVSVSQGSTTLFLSQSSANTSFGQNVSLTATVSVTLPAVGTPSGTVTFLDFATPIGTATVNSTTLTATLSFAGLSYNPFFSFGFGHTLSASYGGDTNFTGSSSSPGIAHFVTAMSDSSTTLAVSANPSVFGQPLTITATVSLNTNPNAPLATGVVTFSDGGASIGTATLDSSDVAVLTSSSFSIAGSPHTLTAAYGGDTNVNASPTSISILQTVNQAGTSTTVTLSANPAVFGQTVTITATVSVVSPGSGSLSGLVTFLDGGASIGTASLSGSVATITSSALALGTHSLAAAFNGDSNLSGSSSATINLAINQSHTSTSLTSSFNPSTVGQSVTFTATVTALAPGFGIPSGIVTFADNGSSLGTGLLDSLGVATFATSSLSQAAHPITAAYTGDTNFTSSISATVSQVVNAASLQVTAFTPTPTGFIAVFNRLINVGTSSAPTLNLYDNSTGTMGPTDVTLSGANSGSIRGSLAVDQVIVGGSPVSRITFIQTGETGIAPVGVKTGILGNDTYTVTLRSAVNGFRDNSNNLLDGNADGTGGDNYVTTFVVNNSTNSVTVTLPDFARGAAQTVNVPANSSNGIPVRMLNNASTSVTVTSVTFTLAYDSTLLTVTGAALASGVPGNATFTIDTSTAGLAVVTFSTPTGVVLGGGLSQAFIDLTASVPSTAGYAEKEILDLQNLQINSGTMSAIDDAALHVSAFLGDTTRDEIYTGLDAQRTSRVAVGLDPGFRQWLLADPVIVGDVNGDHQLTGVDALDIARQAVGLTQPQVPSLPAVTPVIVGPDPVLSIGNPVVEDGGWRIEDGGSLTPSSILHSPSSLSLVQVPVNLNHADGLASVDLAISYDTSRLDVSPGSVHRGSLTQSFDNFTVNVDRANGLIRISGYASAGPVRGLTFGSLAVITFQVRANAPAGLAIINLMQNAGATWSLPGGTDAQGNDFLFDLQPRPSNAANDPLDGGILVVAKPDNSSLLPDQVTNGERRTDGNTSVLLLAEVRALIDPWSTPSISPSGLSGLGTLAIEQPSIHDLPEQSGNESGISLLDEFFGRYPDKSERGAISLTDELYANDPTTGLGQAPAM